MTLHRIVNMRNSRVAWMLLLVLLCGGAAATAQARKQDPNTEPDRKIAAEIKNHNELMENLEYLSDMLGPRLTGSENLRKANHWAEQKFREYGAQGVHLEPWSLGRSWTRGRIEARITAPAEHPISAASYGWVEGTRGTIRGPVVYLNATKPADLEPFKGKLKNAIVLLFEPRSIVTPAHPMLTPYGDSVIPMNELKPAMSFAFFQPAYRFLTEEGAAAMLMPSDKTHGLLNMFDLGWLSSKDTDRITGDQVRIAPTPAAYVSWEDYNLIWRLMQRGKVEMELNIQNSYSDKPVEVYNTVAEIRGSEKPDEIVMLGAHMDSWDLGTGATDNGTGTVAVLEAARALLKSGMKPKRTIRFVLFSGEEQFLLGSKAYLKSHQGELAKISGVLVHDSGSGKVLSIGLESDYAAREIMDQVVRPLHEFGLLELTNRMIYASDNSTFDDAGVPGFLTIQDVLDYNQTHHSQVDTFDRVRRDDLEQSAEVIAIWAYNVAQLPDLLPRKPASR